MNDNSKFKLGLFIILAAIMRYSLELPSFGEKNQSLV